MKANEFVKMVGWGEAKSILEAKSFTYRQLGLFSYINHDLDNLKRLVESHKLVEYMGGIDKAKEQAYVLAMEVDGFNPTKIEKAIADVESCK